MKKLYRLLEWVLVLLLSATVILILLQVFSRYVIQTNIKGVEELARLSIVWGSFLGVAYAALKNEHIRVDMIFNKTSDRGKKLLNITSCIILVISGTVMTFSGAEYVIRHWTYPDLSTSLLYPRSLYYLPVPICGLILALKSLADFVQLTVKRKSENI